MNKLLRWTCSLVLAALVCIVPQVVLGAAVGSSAPDFQLSGSDGKNYRLSDYKGKFVVLEWFNKECPFTLKHYESGNMQALQDTYTKKGVIWLSICSSASGKQGYMTTQEAEKHRMDSHMHSTAVLLDPKGKVGRQYGAKTTPHLFVVNAEGKVIYAGAIDDHNSPDAADIPSSKNYVSLALDQALAGKPVEIAQTPPYGCSIKYK